MTIEKKIWLCEQCAQKVWTLSSGLAQEAGRSGHFGRGFAVVAQEVRNLANKLFDYAAIVRFDGASDKLPGYIQDAALQMRFLSANAQLEILRVNPIVHDMTVNKSMAVLADDLHNLSMEIFALADDRAGENDFVLPEVLSPIKSSGTFDYFFRFSIGGIPLVENTANVREVLYPPKADAESETIGIRGVTIPRIDCYRRFHLSHTSYDSERQTVMIVRPEGTRYLGDAEGLFAVPIDDLDECAVFSSRIGYAVPPESEHIFSNYARECWDAVGGGQLFFVDWQKLKEFFKST